MPRPFRSGTVPQPVLAVLAVLAVAVVLGGLLVASAGAAALIAGAGSPRCEGYVTGASIPAHGGTSGVVTGALIGAEQGACGRDEQAAEEEPSGGAAPAGAIGVDGRTFTRAGEPFFWLGDTAWSLFVNLTRAETEDYLETRAEQGFAVIQAVAIFPQAGGPGPNQYGDSPFGSDLGDLAVTEGAAGDSTEQGEERYDYWDHVDFAVEQAAERGLVMAILPVWADTQVRELVTEDNAGAYGEFLGAALLRTRPTSSG